MNSQVILLMKSLADHDQVAMFNSLILNRIYWFRKLAEYDKKGKLPDSQSGIAA